MMNNSLLQVYGSASIPSTPTTTHIQPPSSQAASTPGYTTSLFVAGEEPTSTVSSEPQGLTQLNGGAPTALMNSGSLGSRVQFAVPAASLLSTGPVGKCKPQLKQTDLNTSCVSDLVSYEPTIDNSNTQLLSHTKSRQEIIETTPLDPTHIVQNNPTVQEIKEALTRQTEPPTNSQISKSSGMYTEGSQSKLETEKMDNRTSNPKLKRVRRRQEGEGGGAEGDKPRVKRAKKKGQRSEQAVDSAIQEELEKQHKRGALKIEQILYSTILQ